MISRRTKKAVLLDPSPWMVEEARHYGALCEEVERLIADGHSKKEAVDQVVRRRRRGIRFACDRERVLRPTAKTLWRKLALWKDDRTPDSLVRRYRRGGHTTAKARRSRRAAGPVYDRGAFLDAVLRRCFVPGYKSLAEVMDSFALDYSEGRKLPGVTTDRKHVRSLWLLPGVSRRGLIKEAFKGRNPALKKQVNTYLHARKVLHRTEARIVQKLKGLK